MLKLCFNLAHSMFDDGYSPGMRNGEETFGYKADDISFCFVIYSGIIAIFFFFLFVLSRRDGSGLKSQEGKCGMYV